MEYQEGINQNSLPRACEVLKIPNLLSVKGYIDVFLRQLGNILLEWLLSRISKPCNMAESARGVSEALSEFFDCLPAKAARARKMISTDVSKGDKKCDTEEFTAFKERV